MIDKLNPLSLLQTKTKGSNYLIPMIIMKYPNNTVNLINYKLFTNLSQTVYH